MFFFHFPSGLLFANDIDIHIWIWRVTRQASLRSGRRQRHLHGHELVTSNVMRIDPQLFRAKSLKMKIDGMVPDLLEFIAKGRACDANCVRSDLR